MASSVAQLCEARQITFQHLIERSGLPDFKVAAIIEGRWTPSPAERQRIASVFSVPVEEIAWGHKTPIQHIYGHGPG